MLNLEEKIVFWINSFDLSIKKVNNLIALYDNVEQLWQNFGVDKIRISKIIGDDVYNKMLFSNSFDYIDRIIKNFEKDNIHIVSIVSPLYPECLKEISSPPIVLYCKGNIELLNSFCIAIVGTRRMSKYGNDVTSLFSKSLALSGVTIVSGLADGVDTVAHSTCLDVKGNTIAVMGSGFNHIYPATNTKLFERIINNNGLVISEYMPNTMPNSYNFPVRNRIIAGLSKGVLITEATEKSGSMHTKNYAIEFNRDLFVVPARITDIYSKGCNRIIKSMQGVVVLEPNDILSNYGKQINCKNNVYQQQLNIDEQMIINNLKLGDEHYEKLIEITNLEPKKLTTLLMRLEIKGVIKKLPGNIYALK